MVAVRTELPADESAPAQARALVREAFCPLHAGGLFDDAELLVSEVVTNAARHGAPPITVEIGCEGEAGLVVRVSDDGTAAPVRRTPGWDEEGGRGVALVDVISDAWGVEPTAAGKQVWFRLRRPRVTG
jgi:anti-sigma regulatory factor (Ser/Thr protein kinase)